MTPQRVLSSVLGLEIAVLVFAVCAAIGLRRESAGIVIGLAAIAIALAVLAIGLSRHVAGVVIGSLVPLALLVGGLWIGEMAILGVVFAGLWAGALVLSRRMGRPAG